MSDDTDSEETVPDSAPNADDAYPWVRIAARLLDVAAAQTLVLLLGLDQRLRDLAERLPAGDR